MLVTVLFVLTNLKLLLGLFDVVTDVLFINTIYTTYGDTVAQPYLYWILILSPIIVFISTILLFVNCYISWKDYSKRAKNCTKKGFFSKLKYFYDLHKELDVATTYIFNLTIMIFEDLTQSLVCIWWLTFFIDWVPYVSLFVSAAVVLKFGVYRYGIVKEFNMKKCTFWLKNFLMFLFTGAYLTVVSVALIQNYELDALFGVQICGKLIPYGTLNQGTTYNLTDYCVRDNFHNITFNNQEASIMLSTSKINKLELFCNTKSTFFEIDGVMVQTVKTQEEISNLPKQVGDPTVCDQQLYIQYINNYHVENCCVIGTDYESLNLNCENIMYENSFKFALYPLLSLILIIYIIDFKNYHDNKANSKLNIDINKETALEMQ